MDAVGSFLFRQVINLHLCRNKENVEGFVQYIIVNIGK